MQEPLQLLLWKRYIYDIICIWTGTGNELESFLARLNTAHRTHRFTWSISNERIEFFDLNILKGGRFNTNRHLDISTHFKKTNTFQYLHFSSSHPRNAFKGLAKGGSYVLIQYTYNKPINKCRKHLFLRNYPKNVVDRILTNITHSLRASYIPALTPSPTPSSTPNPNSSLSPNPSSSTIIPRLVTTYTPHLRLIQLLRKHWSLVQDDPSLSLLFPSPPQLSY